MKDKNMNRTVHNVRAAMRNSPDLQDLFNTLQTELGKRLGVEITAMQTMRWLMNFYDRHKECSS